MSRRPVSRRMTAVEADASAARIARQAAEAALCHLGYQHGLRWDEERFEAELVLLAGVLGQHLRRVEVRTLVGSRVPDPGEVRAA